MVSRLLRALTVTDKYVSDYIEEAITYYAALPAMPEREIIEGNGVVTIREDGTIHRVELRKMEASETTKFDDLRVDTDTVYDLMNKVAFSLAQQRIKLMQDSVGQAADETGNRTIHSGKLTPEDIMRAHQIVTLDFYQNGEPHVLEIVSGPEMKTEYKEAMTQIEKDPSLKMQFDKIIAEQRIKWHVRESNRKLVG